MADLSEFLEQHVPTHIGPDFSTLDHGHYFHPLLERAHDEHEASTVLAVILWQILMETPAYAALCSELKLRPVPWYERAARVVAHGAGSQPDFDLLILDRAYDGTPRTSRLQASPPDLSGAFERWRRERATNLDELVRARRVTQSRYQQLRELLFQLVDDDFALKALSNYEFHVLAARMPELRYTSITTEPWKATLYPNPNPSVFATAGAVVREATTGTGIFGVTIPAHAVLTNGLANPVGWQVDIKGQFGSIVSCDVVSDSCFVKLSHIGFPDHQHKTTQGLIPNGVAPGLGTTGSFKGCGSPGQNSGKITSVSVNIINQQPLVQQSFDLNYLTNPGDSGCALLDQNDHILGFSCCSTDALSNPRFSTWIWADSVFDFHNLQPY